MSVKFEKHIHVEQSQIILECLKSNVDLSKQQLKKLMQNGAVWLENSQGIHRVRRAKKIIAEGDQLHIYFDSKIQATTPSPAILVADEGEYSIWNKPSGMYSQGSKWGDHCAIYRWAEQNLEPQRPAFIVHRLDKAANGLIIIAHSKKIAAKFSMLFERRSIHKKYRATVEGLVEDLHLPYEIKNEIDNKMAISKIISLQQNKVTMQTEVVIEIKTGRKHQIRRHLSGLGCPIVGDRLYGAKNIQQDLQLSSIEVEFICPVSGTQKKYIL